MIDNRLLLEAAQLGAEERKMLLALVILALVALVIALLQRTFDRIGLPRALCLLVWAATALLAFGIAMLRAVNLI